MISKSIGAKILMVVGIAASLSLVGLVLFYTQSQRAIIIQEHKLVTERMVSTVVAGLGAIMETGTASIAQQYAEDIKSVLELEDFRFVRPNGLEAFLDNETIHQVNWMRGEELFSPRQETEQRRLYLEDDPILKNARQSGEAYSFLNEKRLQYTVLMPILNEHHCRRCHEKEKQVLGFARLSTSMRQVDQAIAESRNWAAFVLFVVLILFLMLTYLFLHKVVIAPIRRVTLAMHQVEQGDLNQQVPEPGEDELGQMAHSFNSMTQKLLETYTGMELEQDKLTTIILNAGEGIVVTDKGDQIVLVNPAAERLLGRPLSEIVSQGFEALVGDPPMIKRLLEHPDPNYAESVLQGERYLSVLAARIHTKQGETLGMAALIRDVTTQKRREAYLEAISYTDELTGLLNRRSLMDILAQSVSEAIEKGKPLTLLMLDMDHFKQLNDNHGHPMGDRVLKAFGGLLGTRLRESDHACRYGGEEFSVILTGTDVRGAMKTAEDIRIAVSQLQIDDLSITVSIGLASLSQCHDPSPKCLLEAADCALYLAKQQGRNRTVIYDPSCTENP